MVVKSHFRQGGTTSYPHSFLSSFLLSLIFLHLLLLTSYAVEFQNIRLVSR